MQNSYESNEEREKGGVLKKRLKGVRKRKQNRRGGDGVAPFACDVMASKMRLVEARRRRDQRK